MSALENGHYQTDIIFTSTSINSLGHEAQGHFKVPLQNCVGGICFVEEKVNPDIKKAKMIAKQQVNSRQLL